MVAEDAQARLNPHHAAFAEITRKAWREWIDEILVHFPDHHPRLPRNVVQQLMVKYAKAAFAGSSSVKSIETQNGRCLFQFNDDSGQLPILVRFKHLDGALKNRTYPTAEARRFDSGAPVELTPDGPRLTVGYTLDDTETKLTGIFVAQYVEHGSAPVWHYEIGDAGIGSVAQLPPQMPLAADGKPAVRVKTGTTKTTKRTSTGSSD